MAYPTDDLTSLALDQTTDDPSQARAEILALLQKVQAMLANTGTGIQFVLKLDASGNIPAGVNIPFSQVTGTVDADTLGGSALASILARANHTGTQTLSTISDAGSYAGVSAIPAGDVNEATLAAAVAPWILIDTQTISSQQFLTFQDGVGGVVFDTTYDYYRVEWEDIYGGSGNYGIQFGTSGGYLQSSEYNHSGFTISSSTGTLNAHAINNGTYIQLSQQVVSSGDSWVGWLEIERPGEALRSTFDYSARLTLSGDFETNQGAGMVDTTTALDRFRILVTSGTMTTGTVRLYGRHK